MKSLSEILSSPLYTAAIGAVIGIIAKIVDNRMSDKKGKFMDYLKSAAFCAGLIALWTFITSKTLSGGPSSSLGDGIGYRAAPAPQMRPSVPSGSFGYGAQAGPVGGNGPIGGGGGQFRGGDVPRRMAQPFASQGYQ